MEPNRKGRFAAFGLIVMTFSLPAILPAHGATINVDYTDGTITSNFKCSISEAIEIVYAGAFLKPTAFQDAQVRRSLVLTNNFALATVMSSSSGSNNTPIVTSEITLDGQGFKIACGNVWTLGLRQRGREVSPAVHFAQREPKR